MPILDWVDKEKALKAADGAPYRLLEEVPKLSFGDADNENMLIQGDNLDALKALIPYYAGRVKCIFIDPPYNTGSAFEHYDDNLQHSIWLSLMYPRLELLRELLNEKGAMFICLDDNEAHYMKVMGDEVFGRKNFVGDVAWQKKYSPGNNQKGLSSDYDHILLYAKNIKVWDWNLLPRSEKQNKAYRNPDNDSRGVWKTSDLTRSEHRDRDFYAITTPSGKEVFPAKGRSWSRPPAEIERLRADNRLWFGPNGDAKPSLKRFLTEVQDGIVARGIWLRDEVGDNEEAKKEIKALDDNDIFQTPKPERLVQRALQMTTNPGDLVLDSFLGSGTTAAVAHKMGRKHIGIELGDHAVTHCAPRLQKVIEGEQGGISKACKWEGGGGFRFFRLGEGVFDEAGQINPDIKFPILAAHVWFSETHTPWTGKGKSPLLGVHNGVAYYLLYNGILGDKKPQNGNVLTSRILADLPPHDGAKVIYGEWTPFKADRLRKEEIVFKQTPYDVKAR